MEITVRKLTNKKEMLSFLPLINQLYPSLSADDYSLQLDEMIPFRYSQVGVFEGKKQIGMAGVWIGHKFWCGKYLEIDHVIVLESHRSQGIGKLIFDFMKNMAREEECHSLGLDSFTHNNRSHKMFFKEDFVIKGYHFVHALEESKMQSF
jgi:GNAT superfamily N-acetyltransferase